MSYPSPGAADFAEVRTLNAAFLELLRSDPSLSGQPSCLSAKLAALAGDRAARLAEAPFLLFSLREADGDFWERLHQGGDTRSLFDSETDGDREAARLVAAALGFVWQMARQNPYTLRLICCASLNWAECIAEQPLVTLIRRAARVGDLLRLRADDSPHIWRRLLAAAAEPDPAVRAALLNTVLQTLLVQSANGGRGTLQSAACRMDVPVASMTADE